VSAITSAKTAKMTARAPNPQKSVIKENCI